MITHITRLVAPCVAISLALGVNIAHAFDFVWVNAAMTGKWTARSNWQPYPSPPHVPGAGDTATFIGVYFSPTVEVPDGTSLNRMELDYDAVVDLNISGSMDVDLVPGETLLIDTTATLNLQSGRLITGDTTLLRHGAFNITGLGTEWLPDSVLVAGDVIDSAGIGLALSATASVYGTLNVGDDADYTVWRNTLGATGSRLAADGTGPSGVPDGIVNQLDYQFWKAHFGATAGNGAGRTDSARVVASVPEPASLALAMIAAALLLARPEGAAKSSC